MSWILFSQLIGLMLLTYLLVVGGIGSVIDKRREDAHHRKVGGL